jgi:hypothetical protein
VLVFNKIDKQFSALPFFPVIPGMEVYRTSSTEVLSVTDSPADFPS